MLTTNRPAGIQYWGEAGITQECVDAVQRLIQYDDHIMDVKILTAGSTHALLIKIHPHDLIAIKTGFKSGYVGEGPNKLSYIIELLDAHDIKIEEYTVDDKLLDRLDKSALTEYDIEMLDSADPVWPRRFYEYTKTEHFNAKKEGTLWKSFRPIIPFAVIDTRIVDLAIDFWKNPDDMLMKGYRRFEDCIRKRIGGADVGSKLFQQAFQGSQSVLYWKDITDAESTARTNMIIAAYSAYRNPRAHKEKLSHVNESLSEFMLLNHLFRMEAESIERNKI